MKKVIIILSILLLSVPHLALSSIFPIRINKTGKYFEDNKGKPFLYHADTGWQLFYKLTPEEAEFYMLRRKEQGFNTLQIQISMDVNAPNYKGDKPFINANDFTTVQEAYHDHAVKMVKIAEKLGFLIVITQPWQGCCSEAYGCRADKPLQMNGEEKCYFYGKYLGNKFSTCKNVFWAMGGDNLPKADGPAILAMAKGLRETAPAHQLITYHGAPTHSSTDIYPEADWLGFSMIYTYWKDKNGNPEVYQSALKEYNKNLDMPFVLGESQYEGFVGNDIGTPKQVRRQPYWCLLMGGAGSAYGSRLWFFPSDWREMIEYPGAWQQKHFINFFKKIKWHKLRPDQDHRFAIEGFGQYGTTGFVVTAISEDKKFAVSYFHSKQSVKYDLRKLAIKNVKMKWYDPRTGKYTKSEKISVTDYITLTPPSDDDWVLLLD